MCTEEDIQVVRRVAPEDIHSGDYLTALHIITEVVPWWDADAYRNRLEPIRCLRLPSGAPPPVRVLEVCLPLLLVQMPQGKHRLLDVRRYRLARVSERFGRRVFEQFAADKLTAPKPPAPQADVAKTE
jgi:hypothetical protein